VPSRQRLIDAAQPVLEDLVVDTLETAVLSIRTGTHALCLAQADSRHAIKVAFRIGQLLPLHAGAGQRLLLAFAPPGVQDRVLVAPLRRYTAVTPSAEDLRRSLEPVRLARWAVSMGELTPGAVAVAAPVVHHGRVIAALTVAGPSERCTPTWQREARAALDRASRALTRHLETF
jgi:DNA-binding IclR family transcriptional regulator